MALLTLLACARCPTFGEMTVTDPEGVATDDVLAEINQALADFEAWTGRDGVCVPGIEVQQDIPVESGSDVAGLYRGEDDPILIQSGNGAGPHQAVIHELCHALDYHEDLLASWPEGVFPAESVDESADYPTETARAHEAFARACQDGPEDFTLAAAIDGECGTLTGGVAEGDYLETIVYAAFPRTTVDPTPFSVAVDARPVVIGDEYWVYGAMGFEGTVAVLAGLSATDTDPATLGVLQIDPATGTVLAWTEITTLTPDDRVWTANSDDAPVALVATPGAAGSETTTEAFLVDLPGGTATNLGLDGLPVDPQAAAYMQGILYVASGTMDLPLLTAWDLEAGTRAEVAPTEAEHYPGVYALRPTPDGVEKLDHDGLYRLGEGGTWTSLATAPAYFYNFIPLADQQRLWIGGAGSTPALLDVASDQWRLPEDQCGAQAIFGPTALFAIDGEPFVLGAEPDGSGHVLYALAVDAGAA